MNPDTASYLKELQPLLSLPRETLPQLTGSEARKSLRWAASALGLELVEKGGVAPWFVLLPPGGARPSLTLFAAWHGEAAPVTPAAAEGAERLALAATLAALGSALGSERFPAAVVVAPGATQGSRILAELLAEHRERLQAPAAFWLRVGPRSTDRRRIYLGSRGRVVLGIWSAAPGGAGAGAGTSAPGAGVGSGANAYRIRDQLIEQIRDEAYGPRPLDFELLHKLGQSRDALDFLEETFEDPDAVSGEGEERLKRALFEPRGQVIVPQISHPDRPRAWIVIETAEAMEPSELHQRAQRLAGEANVEMAEAFLWDRISIHDPAIQAEIGLSKEVSKGPEIWPMAPWLTPSGIFTRALGTPLAEWAIPLPAAASVRSPKPESFAAIVREATDLLLRGLEHVPRRT